MKKCLHCDSQIDISMEFCCSGCEVAHNIVKEIRKCQRSFEDIVEIPKDNNDTYSLK